MKYGGEILDFFKLEKNLQPKPENEAEQLKTEEALLRAPRAHFLDDLLQSMHILGNSYEFRQVVQQVKECGKHLEPVVFMGKSGTGKKTLARLLHRLSFRQDNPCFILSCSHMFQLMETGNELDAYLEHATSIPKSTLIVDHPEHLPHEVQLSVLNQLLDSSSDMKNWPRILITTTEEGMLQLILGLGQWGEKLKENIIAVPPLHERADDLPIFLVDKLAQLNLQNGQNRCFAPNALEAFSRIHYKRNFHTLIQIIEKIFVKNTEEIQFDESVINSAQDSQEYWPMPTFYNGFHLDKYMTEWRQRIIWHVLQGRKFNQSQSAHILGITPQAISQFLKSQHFDRSKLF